MLFPKAEQQLLLPHGTVLNRNSYHRTPESSTLRAYNYREYSFLVHSLASHVLHLTDISLHTAFPMAFYGISYQYVNN